MINNADPNQKFTQMSRALIERAMEMRCLSYTSHAKSLLLMETIMGLDSARLRLKASNRQLQEIDKIKTLFIASMAHEFSNPLTSIIGYSDMMIKGLVGDLTEEQQQMLTNIVNSADLLKELVTDAMDIARIDSNAIEPHIETFMLDEAVTHALAIVQQRAEQKGITLQINSNSGFRIRSDRRRLIQCLVNLLSNGIKYTERGSVSLILSKQDNRISIQVRDTGIGITEDGLAHLFEAFQRGENARASRERGSGIGLYLTERIVRTVLKGNIGVHSVVDRGSTFTISLPLSID
ncbi:MAG: HAMP domain-containing histidine kinase [Gammaproteobacteria bacterium]|nr:HAMP domain-containing histidine kinase [Gammaproteobacteria bacterium]